jgi:hypothetical protein
MLKDGIKEKQINQKMIKSKKKIAIKKMLIKFNKN